MMYINLIWSWGHPEVYILMLPAFGIFSEVVSTFSQKRLFGYKSLVGAAIGITLLSMLVWLHHFFTMGAGANVNAFFGIMTGIIAVPTGVQVFNWLATMWRGKIIFTTPMYWFMGFVVTFTLGGVAGVLLGIPGVDFQLHNSLFLVAHFHTMVIGGALFGIFAGITYWFPKVAGFKLNERVGRYAFWCWLVGLIVSFTPLYILGFMGATRRLDHYDPSTGWQPLFIISAIGFIIISIGALLQIVQIIYSFWHHRQEKKRGLPSEALAKLGDPWNARTLEWATASPPAIYNFAVIPKVESNEAFWDMKQNGELLKPKKFEDIEMPKNTAVGIYLSGFAFLIGFAFVWHIWWLAITSVIGVVITIVIRSLDDETEYIISAAEVEKMEKNNVSFYEKNN